MRWSRFAHLPSFGRDTRGVAATEFLLIAPLLVLTLLGAFAIFDWLHRSYVTERATFTIGDLVSRQTLKDDAYLAKVKATYLNLVDSDVGDPELRVMSLLRDANGFKLDWTYNSTNGALSKKPVPTGDLPDIAVGDSVIVTQSLTRMIPPFTYLFDLTRPDIVEAGYRIELAFTAATRPRFIGRIASAQ